MDRDAAIIASIPGLAAKLAGAGVDEWLGEQRSQVINGQTMFLLVGSDRFVTRAEAMLSFAHDRGLISDAELSRAAAKQPLPSDVEGVEIDYREGEE
jgi:hypothetical protein